MRKIFSVICSIVVTFAVSAQNLVPMHNDKGQFGYGTEGSKTFVIKPQWDEARPFNEYGIAIVRKGTSFGIIDKTGSPVGKSMGYSVIAPYDGTEYMLVALGGNRVDDVKKITNRAGLCAYGFRGSLSYPVKGAKWGLLRQDGTFQIAPKYQELSNVMNDRIVFQEKNMLGMMDVNGNVILAPMYSNMTPINNQGICAVENKKNRKISVVDKNGNTIIGEDQNLTTIWQYPEEFSLYHSITVDSLLKDRSLWDNPAYLLPLVEKGSFSWINSDQPYLLASKAVKEKKDWKVSFALYDINGRKILPFAEKAVPFSPSDGITMIVYEDGSHKFYDIEQGSYSNVSPATYSPFVDNRSLARHKENGCYLVDKSGNRVSEIFEDVDICDNRYIVKKNSSYGLITKTGETVMPIESMSIFDANDGVFAVRNGSGFFGYVDKDGKTLIPFDYSSGSVFMGGYAVVGKKEGFNQKEKSGIINLNNEIIVPIQYDKVVAGIDAKGDLAVWVYDNGIFNTYDVKAKRLQPTAYVDMSISKSGTFTKNKNGHCGLIVGGQEVIPCSLADEGLVSDLYNFMQENSVPSVNTVEARAISVRLNPKRNTFKISDKIEHDYWDF